MVGLKMTQFIPRGCRTVFILVQTLLETTDVNLCLKAREKYEECIASQQEWKQIHHLCYWELMWTHSYQQEWQQAYCYADLLCKESRWSKVKTHIDHVSEVDETFKYHHHQHLSETFTFHRCLAHPQAIYMYQKAAILSMMSAEELKKTGENIIELFRSVCLKSNKLTSHLKKNNNMNFASPCLLSDFSLA